MSPVARLLASPSAAKSLPSLDAASSPKASGPRRPAFARRGALAVALASFAALAGCGGGHDDYYDDCNPTFYPAVSVTFVYAPTGQVVATGARGTAYDGRVVEEMTSPDPGYSVDGRTSVLEAGFGRPGVYDVSVVTASGERFDWTGLQVPGDVCGPFTVQLQAPVQFP